MGWLSLIKGSVGPLVIVAVLTFCCTLWVRNSELTTANAKAVSDNAAFVVANDALSTQLTKERLERKWVNNVVLAANAETVAIEPIYRERVVYVEKYRSNVNITKCILASEWVSAHDAAATNPYRMSETRSAP